MPAVLLVGLNDCFLSDAMAEQLEPQSSIAKNTSISSSVRAVSPDIVTPEQWSMHAQFTNVTQWHPAFTSPYAGQNSLDSNSSSDETTDLTLFTGLRLSGTSEMWLNTEIDQGFGLSNTLGLAGFSSGEAYKVGANAPYIRFPRFFYRKVFGLGGAEQMIEPAPNQLSGSRLTDNFTMTMGKFSVVDVFDTNAYAHDPRADFLNWSILEAGAFDYAADAWGYSYGMSLEWTRSWWTMRAGLFDLSEVPNGKVMDTTFSQHEIVVELEERHQLGEHPGKFKLLGFINDGQMGSYSDALQLAAQTSTTPDTSRVRRKSSRTGVAINLEQELSSSLGVFARASKNEGSKEAFEFTEINQSISSGLSLKGVRWGRNSDTIGVAGAVNGLSSAAQSYFAAGGMGILVGDGRLDYGKERILESYYSLKATDHFAVSFNYQHVINPAYNKDRGPVSIYGIRVHGEL